MIKKKLFKSLSRGCRADHLVAYPIEFLKKTSMSCDTSSSVARADAKYKKRNLVISVPKVCGKAVQRNRLRRVVKLGLMKRLSSLPEGRGLWLIIHRQHKLKNPILWKNWKDITEKAIAGISIQ